MQAARGASLSPESGSDTSSTPGWAGPARSISLLVFAVAATVPYAADQLTKAWAVVALAGERDKPLIGGVLTLHLTRNPGAAFSTGTRYTEVFTLIAIVAVLVVLWLARRLGSRMWAVALGVLLAGVAGNLTDRIVRPPAPLRGHVVDFLMLPHWPVFNVADMCINVAAGLILLQAFRGVRLNGSRVADAEAHGAADDRADHHADHRADHREPDREGGA